MANMCFTFLPGVTGEGLMLVVHTSAAPTDSEWDPYMKEIVKHDPRTLRSLAFTDGGAPGGAQRKQLNDFLKGQASLAAVVTASAMVRGVVSALSWFNPKMRAFAPKDTDGALRYLGVETANMHLVQREIQILRKRLGFEDLKSIPAA